MRDIKFRAWDNGKMQKVSFNNLSVNFHHPSGTLYLREEMKPFGDTHITELMQYTGLKDKNGTEIYEGDIVKYLFFDENPKGSVVFKDGAFKVKSSHYFSGDTVRAPGYDYYNIERLQEMEVVGNIYEAEYTRLRKEG